MGHGRKERPWEGRGELDVESEINIREAEGTGEEKESGEGGVNWSCARNSIQ